MPHHVEMCLEVHGSLYAACEDEAQARLITWVREKLSGESAYPLDGGAEIVVHEIADVAAEPGSGYLLPVPLRVSVTGRATGWHIALMSALRPAVLLEKQREKARAWAESLLWAGAVESGILNICVLPA